VKTCATGTFKFRHPTDLKLRYCYTKDKCNAVTTAKGAGGKYSVHAGTTCVEECSKTVNPVAKYTNKGECVVTCPVGTFGQTGTKPLCAACGSTCKTCVDAADNCLECANKHVKSNSATPKLPGPCVVCPAHSTGCSNKTACTGCVSGYFLTKDL
jgi:hypothetical protein